MTTAMQEIPWELPLIEPRHDPDLQSYFKREMGTIPPGIEYFSDCPWVARSLAAFNTRGGKLAHLELDLAEFVGLVVSQDNSCRYCFAAHRILLRSTGTPEARILRLEQDLHTADFDEREQLALDLARRISRANPLPTREDALPLLEAGWSEAAVREIAAAATITIYTNRFSTLPALPPETWERFPDKWWVRGMRPYIERHFRKISRRGKAEQLTPEEQAGPFAYLVEGLQGLPLARSLRQVIDEAWASEITSPRTKALIVATVARGTGCKYAEVETNQLLADQGLGPDEVSEILAHLRSPLLSELEILALPFARESIWYRPDQIQQRARSVSASVSGPEFVELVGLISLANLICRLCLVAHLCESGAAA
ncbi:MAG: carboxymuconolactone decarboxylase family protein [Deltaproteobacteria bacterium]|nr:carboxymuconolactone decarboxylase family protein [Deltaproteobacteria bacterium]MBW2418007.1 carboxymuconolactone decarboxylase family protein [Deltaproteobacteria bacterium]